MTKTTPSSLFPTRSRRHSENGFALVISLSLMALVVLLVISLAALIRIETGASTAAMQRLQAEQNAWLGLSIAVGKLQRTAGPDERTTASSSARFENPSQRAWTGVWRTDGGGGADPVWLVSGGGASDPRSFTANQADAVELLGEGAVEEPEDRVAVPAESIGENEGRYAWWVADEGVKASMTLTERGDRVDYAPFDNDEVRRRLKSLLPGGPQDFATAGGLQAGFDPLNPEVEEDLRLVLSRGQIPFLEGFVDATLLEREWKRNFHGWTTVASGVLAATDGTGLKTDLSREPEALGPAHAAWADYDSYNEVSEPGSGERTWSEIVPELQGASDLRRRVTLQQTVRSDPGDPVPFVFRIAPVVNEVIVAFTGFKKGSLPHVSGRALVSVWNPYTTAMELDEMTLSVSGLPTNVTFDWSDQSFTGNLRDLFDTDPSDAALAMPLPLYDVWKRFAPEGQKSTLLPGRMVSWRTPSHSNSNATNNVLLYNNRTINGAADDNVWHHPLSTQPVAGDENPGYSVPATELSIRLRLGWHHDNAPFPGPWDADPPGGPILFEADLPEFASDNLPSGQFGNRIGFAYRLNMPFMQTFPTLPWLSEFDGADDLDPRAPTASQAKYTPFNGNPNDNLPSKFSQKAPHIGIPTLEGGQGPLINRYVRSEINLSDYSHYEDIPLFELPRFPVLSLGQLQHLMVENQRTFAVGNSWGGYGFLWDRYFYSGLEDGVAPPPDRPAPQFHLNRTDGVDDWAEVKDADRSAEKLLMRGAFNINSVEPSAWRALLQSLRPFGGNDWSHVDFADSFGLPANYDYGNTVSTETGVTDGVRDTVRDATRGIPDGNPDEERASRASGFARFPTSAQETWEYDGNLPESVKAPDGANPVFYRMGIRAGDEASGSEAGRNLSRDQIAELAEAISERVGEAVRSSGRPFESMAEFLDAPSAGAQSLMEEAIEAAGINDEVPYFSSLWLTQADILTALGPQMTNRSDTFRIRSFGESLDSSGAPADSTARIWLEAVVQRVPDFSGPAEWGRQFRIVKVREVEQNEI